MQVDLTERTALVTGGGRGNGRATAEKLARNGARVVVNDLDRDVAEGVVATIEAEGGEALAIAADVSDEDEVIAMVQEATDVFGPIDVLVNNAGVGNAGPFLDEENDPDFQLNLDVHLWGSIHCTRHVLDGMLDAGYGKIVNITSIHTKNAVGQSPQYDVGKFSLLGLTKSLALEFGREGIRVNAVAPGWVDTRMTDKFDQSTVDAINDRNPLGRFAQPEEIGDAVLFLCAPESDYINGHELRVDGGQVPIDRWEY